MDGTTLTRFRTDVYRCLTRAEAALFDLADALLTDPTAHSLVALSQAPAFRRQWPSVYAALRDGQIDRAALRRVFVAHMPAPAPGQRRFVGIDASSIRRPDAATSADRTLVYWPNLPHDATPVVAGWSFSAVVVLPQPVSSWTSVLDHQRIPSSETAITIGVAQRTAILPLRSVRPLTLLDRRYSCWVWVRATAGLPTDQLIRARRDQVLYRDPPPRTGQPLLLLRCAACPG